MHQNGAARKDRRHSKRGSRLVFGRLQRRGPLGSYTGRSVCSLLRSGALAQSRHQRVERRLQRIGATTTGTEARCTSSRSRSARRWRGSWCLTSSRCWGGCWGGCWGRSSGSRRRLDRGLVLRVLAGSVRHRVGTSHGSQPQHARRTGALTSARRGGCWRGRLLPSWAAPSSGDAVQRLLDVHASSGPCHQPARAAEDRTAHRARR